MTTQSKQLANALKHLAAAAKSLKSAKKRAPKKRKNPCSSKANPENPRYHIPKTKRGRTPKSRTWLITSKGRPPIRVKGTKQAAWAKAKGMYRKTGKPVVLDGPR